MYFLRKLEPPCKKANFRRRLGSSIACSNKDFRQPISLALWSTNCAKKKPHAPTTLSIRFGKNTQTLDRLSGAPATGDPAKGAGKAGRSVTAQFRIRRSGADPTHHTRTISCWP